MPIVRIELQLPADYWLSRMSRRFPDTTFWVMALQGLRSGRSIAHIAGQGVPNEELRTFLQHDPSVQEVRIMEAGRSGALLRVEYRHLVLVPLLEETGMVPRYPFALQDGRAYWEVLGLQRISRRSLALVEARLPGSRVLAVLTSRAYPTGSQFTPRQAEVFRRAVQLGYYAFPRRISLTQLAHDLGVDKGSLSVMLVRIEARLAEHWGASSALPGPWVPAQGEPAHAPRAGRGPSLEGDSLIGG